MAKAIQRFNRTGSTQNRPRHGRPKKSSACAQRHIHRLSLGTRCVSAANIAAAVEGVGGQPVSAQTKRRTLHQIGLHGFCPRMKPLLKIQKKAQFIEGTSNAKMYCDILKQSMIPSLQRLGCRAVLQHDNNPKHTSKMTTALLKKLRVKVICGASSNGRWMSASSLTSTSPVMPSWRSGRGLQWQPVKLW